MKTLFLLFSHSLTEDQKQDAQDSLGVSEFVSLPAELQQMFSNVPPELEELDDFLDPIVDWITITLFMNQIISLFKVIMGLLIP